MDVFLEGEHDSTLKGVAVASWLGRGSAAGDLDRSPERFGGPLPSFEVCCIEGGAREQRERRKRLQSIMPQPGRSKSLTRLKS